MEKYLVSTNNYLDLFLLYEGKIVKCDSNIKADIPDGYCVELKDRVVGYYIEGEDFYLVDNGAVFKIDIYNVRSTNTRTETLGEFNFKVYNDNNLIIDFNYVDNMTGLLIFGGDEIHFLEKLSDMLNSSEKINERIQRKINNDKFRKRRS